MSTRAGFVAVVGRPNVGKSTLINALVGQKVSITTPRPQTTRHRVLGIVHHDNAQIALIDTPGLHSSAGRAMNRILNRTARDALAEADIILWLSEANRYSSDDQHVLDILASSNKPVFAVLNKADRVKPQEQLLVALKEMGERAEFDEIIPLSALKGDNTERLLELIVSSLPESPFYYDSEAVTDRSQRFMVAEIIREKLTLRLQQELPYGTTVTIEKYAEEDGLTEIAATIIVAKASQKPIVIGKGGQQLKSIGTAARKSIINLVGGPVRLDIWVRVRENWADSEQELRRLGFD